MCSMSYAVITWTGVITQTFCILKVSGIISFTEQWTIFQYVFYCWVIEWWWQNTALKYPDNCFSSLYHLAQVGKSKTYN